MDVDARECRFPQEEVLGGEGLWRNVGGTNFSGSAHPDGWLVSTSKGRGNRHITEGKLMFDHKLRRTGIGLVVGTGLLLGSSGSAWAHECFNASRSAQGNASAGANSNAWFTLAVADAVQGDVETGTITQTQADCIKAWWAASGNPSSFTIHVAGKNTLAENNPNKGLMSNGKGIDHLFDAYGGDIFTAYTPCGASFGGE